MTEEDREKNLKRIKASIKEFPKVLARKERAFKEKQKRQKAFMPLIKKLLKCTENRE